MRVALEAARRGRPSPNPHVGAVLVQGDCVLGVGHHERAGGDHAEVAALKNASADPAGSTLYVTLEPCNHFGRTPPCTRAILAAGIRRVVIGGCDPNPVVVGGGARALREAGVEVVIGVLGSAARHLVAAWSKVQTQKTAHLSVEAGAGSAARHGRDDFDARLFDAESLRGLLAHPAGAPSSTPLYVLFDPHLERMNDLTAAASATGGRWLVLATPESLLRRDPSLSANGMIEWLPTHDPVSALPGLLAKRGIVTVLATIASETLRQLERTGAIDEVVCFDDRH
jgi:pyrimidine deaminase RibD-like protein